MLFNYYNRKSIGNQPKETPHEEQEDQILQNFYQERRSRSSNVKHHNLLKKNISFFQQEDQKQPKEHVPALRQTPKSHSPSYSNFQSIPIQKKSLTMMSNNQIQTQTKTTPPLLKSNLSKEALPKLSLPIYLPPVQRLQTEQPPKDKLKNESNKRINIKTYLTEMQQQNKENTLDKFNTKKEKELVKKQPAFKLKYKYDKISEAEESSLMGQLSRITSNSRDSRMIHESKHSESSLLQESQNCYEISKNIRENYDITDQLEDIKYKYSQKSFSLKRNSLPTLGESRQLSNSSNQRLKRKTSQCDKNVLMAEEELTYLDENSHPLRETTERFFKLQARETKPQFFEPQKQSLYKQKIKDLQRQVESLKTEQRRQHKFIQSIYKMRKVMLNQNEDCSLKQLWRWIKQLPSVTFTLKK